MIDNIKRRIDFEAEPVEGNLYPDALMNVVGELTWNLQGKLEQEGRFYGMAKSYINSMWDAMTDICPEITEKEEEIYFKINYLFRKALQREYNWLVLRQRLSEGDAIVVILKKLLDVISKKISAEYPYTKRIKTLEKLIGKFFNNIKNEKKEVELKSLVDGFYTCWKYGRVGKYTTKKIELPDLKNRILELEVLENPGERIDLVETETKEIEL